LVPKTHAACSVIDSDVCMVATSELTLTVDAEDDLLQTYEYATMEELQHFVNKLNVNFTNAMRVEYLGPMAVATNTILCLYPVAPGRILEENEQSILQQALLTTVSQVLDNINITDATVFIQDLKQECSSPQAAQFTNGDGHGRRLLEEKNEDVAFPMSSDNLPTMSANNVHVRLKGQCNTGCNATSDFGQIYGDKLVQATPDILAEIQRLVAEGQIPTDYFDQVSTINMVSSSTGNGDTPDTDGSVLVMETFNDPLEAEEFPWLFTLIIAIAVVVLVGAAPAIGVYHRKRNAVGIHDSVGSSQEKVHDRSNGSRGSF